MFRLYSKNVQRLFENVSTCILQNLENKKEKEETMKKKKKKRNRKCKEKELKEKRPKPTKTDTQRKIVENHPTRN